MAAKVDKIRELQNHTSTKGPALSFIEGSGPLSPAIFPGLECCAPVPTKYNTINLKMREINRIVKNELNIIYITVLVKAKFF